MEKLEAVANDAENGMKKTFSLDELEIDGFPTSTSFKCQSSGEVD